jgi:hypothetical protein
MMSFTSVLSNNGMNPTRSAVALRAGYADRCAARQ